MGGRRESLTKALAVPLRMRKKNSVASEERLRQASLDKLKVKEPAILAPEKGKEGSESMYGFLLLLCDTQLFD